MTFIFGQEDIKENGYQEKVPKQGQNNLVKYDGEISEDPEREIRLLGDKITIQMMIFNLIRYSFENTRSLGLIRVTY